MEGYIMPNGKKPTEILKEEHQHVLEKLDTLEEVIGQLDKKEDISVKLSELASFFETDFWVHFTKEEDALFPEIEKFMPRDGGPTGMMLMEHEDLRNSNAELQPAIGAYLADSDDSKVKRTILEWGTHFIIALRNHIAKENDILFMMADMHLDEAQMDNVIKLFGEIEKGEGKGN
jgi:hemerythrin-like domain-containing protein